VAFDAPCTDELGEGPETRGKGKRELVAARVQGRELTARALKATADYFTRTKGRAVVPLWAKRADVSRQQIERWMNPLEIHGALTMGDAVAMLLPDELAYFVAWIAEHGEAKAKPVAAAKDPRHIALKAACRAGAIAEKTTAAMADDEHCDAREWAEIEHECAEGEREFRTAKLAARAAKEQGR
jgi:hypothetical protein